MYSLAATCVSETGWSTRSILTVHLHDADTRRRCLEPRPTLFFPSFLDIDEPNPSQISVDFVTMIDHFPSCIFLVTAIAFLVTAVIPLILRPPQYTFQDVIVAIRPVALERLANLLDPAEEWRLRIELASEEFRLRQRSRIHQTLEIVSRMSHNAAVLAGWSCRAAEGDEHAILYRELHELAVETRAYALLGVLILRTWIILRVETWPFLPVPRLSRLRELCGIEPVASYERLKAAARRLYPDAQTIDHDDVFRNL
jgi:hypothetical protein